MAATPDRTTIRTTVDSLVTNLRANLVAEPPTATKPFRIMAVGDVKFDEHTRPFLTLSVERIRPIGTTQNDKILEVRATFRMAADISASDPHTTILDKIGALEDHFDTLIDIGVVEGSDGFDDREWLIDYPKFASGMRVVSATATQSFVVRAERLQNRIPAS